MAAGKRLDLKRALILEAAQAPARLLADLLRTLSACEAWTAFSNARAMELARAVEPQVIFVEHRGPELDGAAFARELRRSTLACRQAPIVMVSGEATAHSILGARDAGVHEFLRKPYAIRDLERRLEVVLWQPRGWVEAQMYVGPDRRRFNSGDFKGARKRRTDAANRSAPHREAVDRAMADLRQAMGAGAEAQAVAIPAEALRKAAVASGDLTLLAATADLERCIARAREGQAVSRAELEAAAARLWAHEAAAQAA